MRQFPRLAVLFLASCAAPQQPALNDSSWASGRWDVTVDDPRGRYPSWFEIDQQDGQWSGRFVGQFGSARPIAQITVEGNQLSFRLPPQYEQHKSDLVFEGSWDGEAITGTTNAADGRQIPFSARPAPALQRSGEPQWGEPVDLLADGLQAWQLRRPDGPDGWQLEGGLLTNSPPSLDLITRQKFTDFKLRLEFNMPEGSNSGVYLRGRYEVQVQDDHGKEPESKLCGGVYGFIAPSQMAARPAGEWNSYEITLIGRRIRLVFNGQTVIDNQEIPGITGGALDSRESEAGPLMLQGDHQAIQYRNIVLTPALPQDPGSQE